jgi:hypothetical protein
LVVFLLGQPVVLSALHPFITCPENKRGITIINSIVFSPMSELIAEQRVEDPVAMKTQPGHENTTRPFML